MSLLAQASNYDSENKNNRFNGTSKKRMSTLPTPGCRNKTIKKMLSPNLEDEEDESDRENFQSLSPSTMEDNKERSAKVQEIINNIGSVKTDDDGTSLANFNSHDPLEKPVVKSVAPSFSTNLSLGNSYESYKDIYTSSSRIGEYPYYKPTTINSTPVVQDKFNDKMNYIIHLLEEQQKEPTNHITEEFILYTFLGIFVIYIVDSFSRVGKYIR